MDLVVATGIGIAIGVWIGVIVMALFKVASDSDDIYLGDEQYRED